MSRPAAAGALEIHLLVDPGALGPERTARLVGEAVRGGVTAVQMRRKDGPTRELIRQAREMLAVVRPLGARLIVNDRVDVAAAAGADGVHVGQDDMPAAAARRLLGPGAIVGLSVWDLAHLEEATPGVVDYVGVGPVFPTTGKDDAVPPLGLAGLAAITARARVRVLAIGGIAPANAASVAAVGVDGVAVIGAIGQASDPGRAAAELRRALALGADARAGGRP